MKSSTLLAFAGALTFAGAAYANTYATHASASPTDYKAAYEQCKLAPGSDQARCKDAVGMRAADADRTGIATTQMGSLQSADRCKQLYGDDQRTCLMNDKAG
jgi:hypothetical protein